MSVWTPQPGPQVAAATCPVSTILFGGTRGGGKSDCAIGRQLRGAEKYGADWNGLMVRRKYKDLHGLRRRWRRLITAGDWAEPLSGGDTGTNYVRFRNGAVVQLTACLRYEHVESHQGQEYTEISVEECTQFPFFRQMINYFRGCLRSAAGVPCRLFCTGNPGGAGHQQVKRMFIDPEGFASRPDPGTVIYDDAGESYVFIKSFLADNKILTENDPEYVRRLQSISDPVLRKAWLEGDWDVFLGQAFAWREDYHVVEPMPVPKSAPKYMTFDWGSGAPFSVGWWWVDNDGRLYRFAEWYGWNGVENEGLRMTDSEIAEGILEREDELGIIEQNITRLCDPTCFNKKPDYQGGGQGPSTADVWAKYGLFLKPGDPSRHLKIRQFRERLRIRRDDEGNVLAAPMLQVYRSCKQFLRTVPNLAIDADKVEDIDTDQEDHIYDEACHVCMARPLSDVQDQLQQMEEDQWYRSRTK